MKKRIITGISFLLMAGVVLLFAGSVSAETVELKFSTSFSPKHTQQVKVFEPWAEKISELTNGGVKVNFFPGGALGKAGDQVDLVKSGIADITYTLHDYTPGRFPLTSVFELPYMVPSAARTSWAMWKMYEKVPEFQKEYKDFKVLSLFCHPGGNFNTVDKPIKTLDDFKGMKIRTASPSVTKALKIFGATPVNMPITETYTAMERGVVDGTVLPWEGLFVFNLYELANYCVESDFYTMTMTVLMNKNKWNSLPPDVKDVLEENSGMSMSLACARAFADVSPALKQKCIEAGVEVVDIPESDRQKMRDLVKPLREEWVEEMNKKGLSGQKALDNALKYLEESKGIE